MKSTLLLTLSLMAWISTASADQTINYPEDKPIFSISFPDGWKVETGESVSASSADDLVNMELIALDAEEAATAMADARKSLEEELKGIKWLADPEKGEINGIQVTFLNGNVTLEGVKMAVNCAVFAPKKEETFFMLFNIIPLEALKDHGKDLDKILNSVKGK
ncbi:MAG: hypothetical protein JNG86_13765 [Verrucomicrobiaceae bacterium]|nr:hypothetical protein [Verrucomicrobiaceae bacterium]